MQQSKLNCPEALLKFYGSLSANDLPLLPIPETDTLERQINLRLAFALGHLLSRA